MLTITEIIDLADGHVRTGPRLPMRALDGCAAHYNGFIYWVAGYNPQEGELQKVFRARGTEGEEKVQTAVYMRYRASHVALKYIW